MMTVTDEETRSYTKALGYMRSGTSKELDTTRNDIFYLFNGHGDVTALTDKNGTVTKTYEYDAFGNEINPSTTDTNPFRYCGEYYDSETGSIYLRARYYNPSIGRFTAEDPIKDGLNWYAYASQNPVMFMDPWGLAITKEDQAAYDSGQMSKYAYNLLVEATNEWNNANPNDYTTLANARAKAVAARRMYNPEYVDDFDYTFGTGASAIDDGTEGLFMKTEVIKSTDGKVSALSRITYKRFFVYEHPYVQMVSSCGYAVGCEDENIYSTNIEVTVGQTKRNGFPESVTRSFDASTYYIMSNFSDSIPDAKGFLNEDLGAVSDYYFSNGYRLTINNNKNLSSFTYENGRSVFGESELTVDDYRAMLGGR